MVATLMSNQLQILPEMFYMRLLETDSVPYQSIF